MTILKFHFFDFVLMASLSYLSYDAIAHSNDYSSCSKPINYWLLAVYISMILLRCSINIVINSDRESLVKCFRFTLICFIIPFLFEWTVHGTIWYLDITKKTPDCIPSYRLPPLIIWWLFVCYVVLTILFCVLIYELIKMVNNRRIRALIQNYINNDNPNLNMDYLTSLMEEGDLNSDVIPLSKNEFNQLDNFNFCSLLNKECQCSICFEDMKENEQIVKLIGCGHLFHKICLELWLSRKPLCPNCKRNIRNNILLNCKNDSLGKRETAKKDFRKELELEEEEKV